jgi:spectinomycin phosphotransferase
VREPPADLSTDALRDALQQDYGLPVAALTFLPLGHDSSAWVYRADTDTGGAYFVKARRALVSDAGLAIPHHLNANGVADVVAPIAATDGRLSVACSGYVVIVYPFVSGETGLHGGMTDQQWVQFGQTLRPFHETQ